MLSAIVSYVAGQLLIRAVLERDRELLRLYWDLQYLRKFGLLELEIPSPIPGPGFDRDPTPTPIAAAVTANSHLILGVIDLLSGGEEIEGDLASSIKDTAIRREAAKGLLSRLQRSTKLLKAEIARLG